MYTRYPKTLVRHRPPHPLRSVPGTRIRRIYQPGIISRPGTILRYANQGQRGLIDLATASNYAGDFGEANEINGDGTANRVLRTIIVEIEDGTNANTIEAACGNKWNASADGPTDNIGKGATVGNYTLSAAGDELYIDNDALDPNQVGNVVQCLTYDFISNASNTYLAVYAVMGANDMWLYFKNGLTNAAVDLTALVDTGIIHLEVTYLTDA